MDYEDESYVSDEDMSYDGDESQELTVNEPPIDAGSLQQFLDRGRSIQAELHPYLEQGFAWISGPYKDKNSQSHVDVPFQKIEAALYQIPGRYDGTFVTTRAKLQARCAELFEELQYMYNDNLDTDILGAIAKTSRSCRAAIDEALEQVAKVAESDGVSQVDEIWQQTLFDMTTIWKCAEAIYLPMQSESLLCDSLMDWVNTLDPRPTLQDGEDIMSARKPYMHPDFWDYVSKGILRGLFDMVGTCLQNSGLIDHHSQTARAVNDLCLLLRTCPRAAKYASNVQDFRERHRIWRSKVARANKDLTLPDPEIASSFRQVYELLKGDKDAVYRQSDSWQECLAALALLFDPAGLKAPKDLRILFEMITESDDFGLTVDRTLPSEEACAAFCGELIPKAITKCREIDLSLAALLADLLEKAEILQDVRSGDLDLTIRDVLILALGDECATDRYGWNAAVSYWRTVGDVGIDSIQQLITRIPAQTQSEVDELLILCNDLDLLDEASEIETVWARKLEIDGKHNEAINAYDRADRPLQIDRLNWRLFKDSLLQGHAISTDIDLAVSLQSPLNTTSSTIASLMAAYAALAKFYENGSDSHGTGPEKLNLLSALLRSPDIPKKYMAILMAEMLPFLNTEADSFTSRDLFDTLAAAEEFYDSAEYQEGVEFLRMALQNPKVTKHGWRTEIGSKLDPEEILAFVRLQIGRSLATKITSE